MGTKYIIEVEDKPFELLSGDGFTSEKLFRVKGFNSLVFDWNGLNMLTPYIEPDLELIKKKAHENGYGEGYQDGYSKGMNDYLQNPEVKEESDRAYAHGYSDAESKFSEIRKEAYEQGQKDLRESCVPKDEEAYGIGYNEGFQCGLDLAWDAARKIVIGDINFIGSAFGSGTRSGIIRDLTASEVIKVLKDYEQKQDAEIKIGNEVKAFEKKPFIVTGFGYGDNEEDVYCYGFVTENGISTSAKKNSCVRTGRHFDEIASIFKKMRNESNEQIDT